jgi:hypothetical protein
VVPDVFRRPFGALRLTIPAPTGESSEPRRIEPVLATARAGVALCSLIAVISSKTGRYPPLAHPVILAYVTYSLAMMVVARTPRRRPPRWVVHALDLGWAALVMLATTGVNSPFFGLFVFAILAAAYRAGLRETLTTSAASVLILFALLLLALGTNRAWLSRGIVDTDLFITRVAYVIMVGLLL